MRASKVQQSSNTSTLRSKDSGHSTMSTDRKTSDASASSYVNLPPASLSSAFSSVKSNQDGNTTLDSGVGQSSRDTSLVLMPETSPHRSKCTCHRQ